MRGLGNARGNAGQVGGFGRGNRAPSPFEEQNVVEKQTQQIVKHFALADSKSELLSVNKPELYH